MSDKVSYMIERADPAHTGHVMPHCFLGINGSFDGYHGGGKLEWLPYASYGFKFGSRKDAEMLLGALIALSDYLPHGKALPGLRSGDPRAIVTEHMWK